MKNVKKSFFVELSPYYVWCFFKRGHFFVFVAIMAIFFSLCRFSKKKVRFPPPRQKICFKTFLIFLTTNDQNLPMNLSFPGNFFPIKSLVSFAFI